MWVSPLLPFSSGFSSATPTFCSSFSHKLLLPPPPPPLILCQLSSSYLTLPSCSSTFPPISIPLPVLLLSRAHLRVHNGAATCPVFFFFLSFIAFLPDNSPVLTGWSYYPLYGTSMLRGFYEILVPVDKMMELLSAVIPSRITASVGKYTTPWIIDRVVAALLLTNSWPVLKGPHNPEEYIG